jgi:hypothetical protein
MSQHSTIFRNALRSGGIPTNKYCIVIFESGLLMASHLLTAHQYICYVESSKGRDGCPRALTHSEGLIAELFSDKKESEIEYSNKKRPIRGAPFVLPAVVLQEG